VEVLLYTLVRSLPAGTLAMSYAQEKKQALSAMRSSAVSDRLIEHLEHSLARYEKALGL
jgi:hypothetical protein